VVRVVDRYGQVPDLGGLAKGPGMFALKEESDIRALLEAAGFHTISVQSFEPVLLVGGGGSVDETAAFLFGMGILRGLLGQVREPDLESAIEGVRAELAEHHRPGIGVQLGAGAWLVNARA